MPEPEVGAGCVSSARSDLRGGIVGNDYPYRNQSKQASEPVFLQDERRVHFHFRTEQQRDEETGNHPPVSY